MHLRRNEILHQDGLVLRRNHRRRPGGPWSIVRYRGDELVTDAIDRLTELGYIADAQVLSPGTVAPACSIVVVSNARIERYAEMLGFSNPRCREFLMMNPHLHTAEFVIGVRMPRSRVPLPGETAPKLCPEDRLCDGLVSALAYTSRLRHARSSKWR